MVASRIARIEQPPKSNISFPFPLSNVTDDILEISGLVGQNGNEQHPFYFGTSKEH